LAPLGDQDYTRQPPAHGFNKEKTVESGNEHGRRFLRCHGNWVWYQPGTDGDFHGHFACRVVGRIPGPPANGWILQIEDATGTWSVQLRIDSEGALHVFAGPFAPPGKEPTPPARTINHPALRPHGQSNSLLVVVGGRQLELYVNDTAVLAAPLLLDQSLSSKVKVKLGFGSRSGWGSQAEF
jgi:hypothetical protein